MTTEAQSIGELAVKAHGAPVVVKTDTGREFLVYPSDQTARETTLENSLEEVLPVHTKQAITLQTVESLVDYLNRFKTENTVLLADMSSNEIVGLIDYHAPSGPAFVEHRATMALPYSEEWRLWTGISGKLMEQLAFARFLEENGGDIQTPAAAEILDAMRDLQANRKVNFTKAVRTSSDNENFEFTDETELKKRGGVEIPTRFLLSIPVYFGEPPTEIYAFLRWKLDDGHLSLGVALNRVEHVRQAVFKAIVLDAAESTDRPAMFGKLR